MTDSQRRDTDRSEESRFGQGCEGRGQDGGDDSFAVYNKEGEIVGAGIGGQVLAASLFCPVQGLVISTPLPFISNKLMPGASSTRLSISHISEVTLASLE